MMDIFPGCPNIHSRHPAWTNPETANRLTQFELENQYAIQYNRLVLDLLAKPNRDDQDDALMAHAAHCAYLYSLHAGTEANRQRGAWLLSRVYAEIGEGMLARYYACECIA